MLFSFIEIEDIVNLPTLAIRIIITVSFVDSFINVST